MSKISMDEKLKDLKKVIFKLSEIGCMLSTENEKQSAMLIAKDKHISDLEEQVNKLYADNDETMKSNTDYYAYENQSAFNIVLLEIDSDGSPTGTMYYKEVKINMNQMTMFFVLISVQAIQLSAVIVSDIYTAMSLNWWNLQMLRMIIK